MNPKKKHALAEKRRWRVRAKVSGTALRPRMAVKFTGCHIYVQFIDDTAGRTLAAVGTRDKGVSTDTRGANVANATFTGQRAAEAAKAKGIDSVVFDKGAARYHGKVKALADAARAGGLKF